MKTDVIEKGEIFRKLKVEVAPEQVAAEYEKVYARLAKDANLPGFRKGKVPRDILEKQIGPSVQREVLDGLLPQATMDAVKEHSLQAVGRPRIEDLVYDGKGPLSFTARVEVKPDFKLASGLEGLALSAAPAAVSEAEVAEQIEAMRQRAAKPGADLDRAAAKGDLVVVDFEGSIDGQPFQGGSAKGFHLVLGRNQLIPGFEDQLVGVKKGETREVRVSFPEDYPGRDVAGKAAIFLVNVAEAKALDLPPLDDAFAKTFGPEVTGLDFLKERVREALQTQKARARRMQLMDAAAGELIAKHSFPVPQALVDYELQAMVDSELSNMRARGVEVSGGEKGVQALAAAMRPGAEKRARLSLVLERLAEEKKIAVTDADFEAEMGRLAPQLGMEQAAAVQWARRSGRDEGIRSRLLEQKALEWVIEKAKVKDAA